jgi:tRNA pseudouridine38-40 synthase
VIGIFHLYPRCVGAVDAVVEAMPTNGTIRIAMGVEYDGSGFHGFQLQKEARTIQEWLEQAIGKVADHAVRVHCAGRTDAGVHAIEQVIHFDTGALRGERSWTLGTNANLPPDINALWARSVSPEFHARFRATARHYVYMILSRPTRPSLMRSRAAWVHRDLDLDAMRRAAMDLVGTHDFSSFRALGCQAKSPVRSVSYLDFEKHGQTLILRIGADGFLHHMVRNIAGALMAVGCGDRPVSWMSELLQIRNRAQGGVTAPPQGLYFLRADYPARFDLPQSAPQATHLNL